MVTNTAARTSGIERATTAPARMPRAKRLTPRTIAIASHRAFMNSFTASSTVTGWSAISVGSMPTGRFALISCMACSTLRPRARTSPPVRMAMASSDALFAIDAEHRLGRIGRAACGRCHRTCSRRVKVGSFSSGSGGGRSPPRLERFASKDSERGAGCKMALDIKSVMDGGVSGEEALG